VEQLMTWLDDAAKHKSNRSIVNRFIVLMLIYVGLRSEELLTLRIADTPYYHGKPVIDVKCGKGRVARPIIIPTWLSTVIKDFIKNHRPNAKPGSVLIASEKGFRTLWISRVQCENKQRIRTKHQERSARIIYQCLYDRIVRIGVEAGIGHLTPHMLRHTFGTRMYREGKDLLAVQDALGHVSPNTTMIYARTVPEDRQKQADAMPVYGAMQAAN
jgi:integrase